MFHGHLKLSRSETIHFQTLKRAFLSSVPSHCWDYHHPPKSQVSTQPRVLDQASLTLQSPTPLSAVLLALHRALWPIRSAPTALVAALQLSAPSLQGNICILIHFPSPVSSTCSPSIPLDVKCNSDLSVPCIKPPDAGRPECHVRHGTRQPHPLPLSHDCPRLTPHRCPASDAVAAQSTLLFLISVSAWPSPLPPVAYSPVCLLAWSETRARVFSFLHLQSKAWARDLKTGCTVEKTDLRAG